MLKHNSFMSKRSHISRRKYGGKSKWQCKSTTILPWVRCQQARMLNLVDKSARYRPRSVVMGCYAALCSLKHSTWHILTHIITAAQDMFQDRVIKVNFKKSNLDFRFWAIGLLWLLLCYYVIKFQTNLLLFQNQRRSINRFLENLTFPAH